MTNPTFLAVFLLLGIFLSTYFAHLYMGFYSYWFKLGRLSTDWAVLHSPISSTIALMFITVVVIAVFSIGAPSLVARLIFTAEPVRYHILVLFIVVLLEELMFRGGPLWVLSLLIGRLNKDSTEDTRRVNQREEEFLYFLLGLISSVAYLVVMAILFALAGKFSLFVLVQFIVGLVYYWIARVHGSTWAFFGHFIWALIMHYMVWWGTF